MASSHYVYRLTLAPGQRVRVHNWDPQNRERGSPLGPLLTFDEARQAAVAAKVAAVVGGAAAPTRQQIRALGHALAELLFDDELRIHLFEAYEAIQGTADTLLRMELEEPAGEGAADRALARLPWEFLCIPYRPEQGLDIFPGAQPGVVLSRRPAGWTALEPIQLDPDEKLRIGVVVADPAADLGTLRQRISALAAPGAPFAEPVFREVSSWQQIDALLEEVKPHLFHFVGASRRDATGAAEIMLTSETGVVRGVEPEAFAMLLRRHTPSLAFFQPGSAAQNGAPEAFLALARKAMTTNVPVAIGMQHTIRPGQAYLFAQEFYARLGRGEPVDKAVQEARYRMADLYESPEFGSPVLFMRVRDGDLFNRKVRVVDVGEPPLAEKLRHSLMQLDYTPQQQQFNDAALADVQRVGAILITGRPRTGKRWLLGRLTQTARLVGGTAGERIVQADLWDLDPTVGAIWNWLATSVNRPASAAQPAVIEALLRLRETQHLFIVLENAGDDPGLLQEILTQVWAPLATAGRQQASGKWLLLFLMDNGDRLAGSHVNVPAANPPLLVQLDPTPNRFPQGSLSAWLNNPATLAVPPLIRQRQLVQQQIPVWEAEKFPRVTLEAICELCGLKWRIVEGRWLKT